MLVKFYVKNCILIVKTIKKNVKKIFTTLVSES